MNEAYRVNAQVLKAVDNVERDWPDWMIKKVEEIHTMNYYKASPQLEAYILDNAPLHEAVAEGAPSTYKELRSQLSALSSRDPILVFDGGCDNTIYSKPEVNHALRAMHDIVHYNESLGFNVKDECEVVRQMILDAESLSDDNGLTEEDLHVLFLDLAGQVLYHDHHGAYVIEQDRFVAACLKTSLPEVLLSNEVF